MTLYDRQHRDGKAPRLRGSEIRPVRGIEIGKAGHRGLLTGRTERVWSHG
jgi:hypothetical protein